MVMVTSRILHVCLCVPESQLGEGGIPSENENIFRIGKPSIGILMYCSYWIPMCSAIFCLRSNHIYFLFNTYTVVWAAPVLPVLCFVLYSWGNVLFFDHLKYFVLCSLRFFCFYVWVGGVEDVGPGLYLLNKTMTFLVLLNDSFSPVARLVHKVLWTTKNDLP